MQGQTSNTIANQAINLIGDNQPAVSGFDPVWDGSPAGKALQTIYGPTVQAVQREYGWDASRRQVTLALSGNAGPFLAGQFSLEYIYPANGIEIWEVQPAAPADKNDPLPENWTVGNTLVNGVQTKVLWTDIADAVAIYNNNPTEAVWDAGFQEAVVRAIASKLAEALAGKPETAGLMGQTAQMASEMNKGRGG